MFLIIWIWIFYMFFSNDSFNTSLSDFINKINYVYSFGGYLPFFKSMVVFLIASFTIGAVINSEQTTLPTNLPNI